MKVRPCWGVATVTLALVKLALRHSRLHFNRLEQTKLAKLVVQAKHTSALNDVARHVADGVLKDCVDDIIGEVSMAYICTVGCDHWRSERPAASLHWDRLYVLCFSAYKRLR
eukprot:1157331-Pelagomonas_calceolata.AAC.3